MRHSAGSLFDGYALTVSVTNGLLTVSAGAGALSPKINFIEIGATGSTIDAATTARVAAAAAQATLDTAKPKAKTPPTVKRNIWGDYVDELVSYTVKKPRKSAVRYYAHANHLYSIAAVTSATGSVVERWSYNAYGVATIKNSVNATIAKSAVGNDRGFTGYKLDGETALYAARARMYSAKLGRFTARDPSDYVDGYGLYSGYFVPNRLDPSGEKCKASITLTSVNVTVISKPWVVTTNYVKSKAEEEVRSKFPVEFEWGDPAVCCPGKTASFKVIVDGDGPPTTLRVSKSGATVDVTLVLHLKIECEECK